jgi:hypothetical protein
MITSHNWGNYGNLGGSHILGIRNIKRELLVIIGIRNIKRELLVIIGIRNIKRELLIIIGIRNTSDKYFSHPHLFTLIIFSSYQQIHIYHGMYSIEGQGRSH